VKDLSKYIAVERFYGKLAVKARSMDEVELNRRLQNTFDKAQARLLERLRGSDQLHRAIAMSTLDPLYNEVGTIIYTSVLEAAEGAPIASDLLRDQSFTASRLTMDRLKGNLNTTLAQAYQQGLGTRQTAELVEEQFSGLTSYEAERIARTEVNSAQSNARVAKMTAAGVQYIQWWTARDNRVRSSHKDLHGLIVKKGNYFPNGLKHPHDRSGPLEEWINCRCRPIPYLMPAHMAPPSDKEAFKESELIRLAA